MSRAANNTKAVGTKAAQRAVNSAVARDVDRAAQSIYRESAMDVLSSGHAKSSLHVKHVVPKYDFDRAPEVDKPGGTYVGLVESLEAELSSVVARNNRTAHVLNRLSGYCEGPEANTLENVETAVISMRLFRILDGLRRERERGNDLLDALEALV